MTLHSVLLPFAQIIIIQITFALLAHEVHPRREDGHILVSGNAMPTSQYIQ